MDSWVSGGIWKNKENTEVRIISHTLQPGLGNHSSQWRYIVWCRGMPSSQNDWWDIKSNSSHIESLASCEKKWFANRKRSSWDYILSLKVPLLYLWSTLHSKNRPQATTHHFLLKKDLPMHTANRLQRWGTILLNYNFKMEYLASKKFNHVDRLSRLIPKHKKNTGGYNDCLSSIWMRI